jgi:hypothetical protein
LLHSSDKSPPGFDNVSEQEDPKQDDGVTSATSTSAAAVLALPLGAASTSDAVSTLDLLSERDDWPPWFIEAIDYFMGISEAEAWVTLLSSFVKLEMGLGFAGTVSHLITGHVCQS